MRNILQFRTILDFLRFRISSLQHVGNGHKIIGHKFFHLVRSHVRILAEWVQAVHPLKWLLRCIIGFFSLGRRFFAGGRFCDIIFFKWYNPAAVKKAVIRTGFTPGRGCNGQKAQETA